MTKKGIVKQVCAVAVVGMMALSSAGSSEVGLGNMNLFGGAITAYAADGDIIEGVKVKYNGELVTFAGQQPVIVDGRTLVPVRGVFEKMGFVVGWDETTATASLKKEGTIVEIIEGEGWFKVNGEVIVPDVPPQIMNGRFMLPLRAISEATGVEVGWDEASLTVSLTSKKAGTGTITSKADLIGNEKVEEREQGYFMPGGGAMITGTVSVYTPDESNPYLPKSYFIGTEMNIERVPLYVAGKNNEVAFGDYIGRYSDGYLIYLGMTREDLISALGNPTLVDPSHIVDRTTLFFANGVYVDVINMDGGEYVYSIPCGSISSPERGICTVMGVTPGDSDDYARANFKGEGGVGSFSLDIWSGSGVARMLTQYWNPQGGTICSVSVGFNVTKDGRVSVITLSMSRK